MPNSTFEWDCAETVAALRGSVVLRAAQLQRYA